MAIWITPTMGVTHLIFAIGTTLYILVAIQFEERDLINHFGEKYLNYKRHTPMLLPKLPGIRKSPEIQSQPVSVES